MVAWHAPGANDGAAGRAALDPGSPPYTQALWWKTRLLATMVDAIGSPTSKRPSHVAHVPGYFAAKSRRGSLTSGGSGRRR